MLYKWNCEYFINGKWRVRIFHIQIYLADEIPTGDFKTLKTPV